MPGPSVTLLTNYVPPYRVPLFHALECGVSDFRVLVSIPMAANRPWKVQRDGLNVETQKTLTFRRPWKHPHGFQDQIYIHIPYDTLNRLTRLKPEVIISAELGARTVQAIVYRSLNPKCRLIVWATLSEHSEKGRGRLRELLRQKILPRADAVLVNGRSGAKYVRRFGVPDERIFLTPQTTDVCQFSTVPLERDNVEGHRLLYVGQLIERKGLVPFLSTLSQWAEAHPSDHRELWLVGDGPQRATLEKMSFPPNLTLRFWGNVSYRELPGFYAQAGILVFPTLADEWGLVVNEAMAAGLPVLGSLYSQAVEELVEDGSTGWTFRSDHAEEMYRALDHALGAPVMKLAEMRLLARRRAERLTPEFVADRILQAIQFVHSGGGCSLERNFSN